MQRGEKNGWLRRYITHTYGLLILQQVSHRSFQKHEFFLQFILSANKKIVLKVSVTDQVIKKDIFSCAHLGFSEDRSPNFRIGVNQYKTKKKQI